MSLERSYLESAKRRLTEGDFFARYKQLDAKLVEKKFPETSPWWLDTIREFYASRKRQLVLRVGRRGGKSSTLCRVAVAEALWGKFNVPPGDIGVIAIISINKPQARERLRTLEAILTAIGVPFKRSGDTIELPHRNIKFEVFAATVFAAVGFTAVCVIADEVAAWRNEETGANPADSILSFLRPTLATQPNAKIFLSSSPFSTLDAHHKAFIEGDTARQMVRYAPTHVANPSPEVAEEVTKLDEPDPLEWQRQYLAIPMSAGSLSFFDPIAIERAIDTELLLPLSPRAGDVVTAGGDLGFRSDSSALALAYRRGEIYHTAELIELRPQPNEPLKPSVVVKTFAEVLKRHGCAYLMGDNHYRQSVSEHLESEDLHFTIAPEGAKGNQEVYVRFRRLLLDGQIKLPKHERLIDQLKLVTSQPTAGGAISIKQPRQSGGGHGDLVSALVLACYQRGGSEIAGVTEKFGTPSYWKKYNSPEAINAREELQIEKEEREAQEAEDKPWWDS
jgi:phage terminase large subunit-like protein